MISSESKRLEAVSRFMVLDESITRDLNDIVNLTAQICDSPIAMITLIDEDMQWFKASKGVDIYCNTREASFCRFTIEQDDLLVVNDAALDSRFANHPFVTGEPHIKFYAGANLTTRDGLHAGTLCVLDINTKEFTAEQRNALQVLARQVINLMELNWSLQTLDDKHQETLSQKKEIETSQLQLRAIFDSSKDVFVLLGIHFEVLAFNKAANNHFLKVCGQEMVVGASFSDYIEKSTANKLIRYYNAAMSGHAVKGEFYVRKDTEFAAWMETSFMPVKNGERVSGVALNAADITSRKKHEEQITLQNDALQRIAIIQSHELRRPVASLMGMIQLIKLEEAQPYENYAYFRMIETTVNELDNKICGIVAESETTLNNSISVFN